MEERKEERHPCFGSIRFTRVSGSDRILYGSTVRPNSYIRLTIAQGYKQHSLGSTKYSTTGLPLIEVDLSPAQFAELLVAGNDYCGVPCTIVSLKGERVEQLKDNEDVSETKRVLEDIRQKGKEFAKPLDTYKEFIEDMIKSKAITKKAGEALLYHFFKMDQDMKSNIPFYLKQLDEAAGKVVHQKRVELDAVIQNEIMKLGMKAYAEQLQQQEALENANDIIVSE